MFFGGVKQCEVEAPYIDIDPIANSISAADIHDDPNPNNENIISKQLSNTKMTNKEEGVLATATRSADSKVEAAASKLMEDNHSSSNQSDVVVEYENITVVVKMRPFSMRERQNNASSTCCVEMQSNSHTVKIFVLKVDSLRAYFHTNVCLFTCVLTISFFTINI
jgi:hypothetical protein